MEHPGSEKCWMRGCKAKQCQYARRKAQNKRRKYLMSLGRPNPNQFVDARPVIRHMEWLFILGHTNTTIAERSGVPLRTVMGVMKERDEPLVTLRTSTKIMNIPLESHDNTGPRPGYVNGIGTWRRTRAIHWAGYTARDIANATGLNERYINRLANSAEVPDVRVSTAKAIAAFFDYIVVRDYPNKHKNVVTRNLARRKGWKGPGVWQNIDDPKSRDWRY